MCVWLFYNIKEYEGIFVVVGFEKRGENFSFEVRKICLKIMQINFHFQNWIFIVLNFQKILKFCFVEFISSKSLKKFKNHFKIFLKKIKCIEKFEKINKKNKKLKINFKKI